jgi:hypothetical protein
VPGRPLQKAGAEPLFQRLHGGSGRRTRHAYVDGGGAEAAAVNDPNKKFDYHKPVHCHYFTEQNNDVQ